MAKAEQMQHAIAIENVGSAQGLVHRVLGIAQVDAIQAFWNFANHLQIGRVEFGVIGGKCPTHVGVLARYQRGPNAIDDLRCHASSKNAEAVSKRVHVGESLPRCGVFDSQPVHHFGGGLHSLNGTHALPGCPNVTPFFGTHGLVTVVTAGRC